MICLAAAASSGAATRHVAAVAFVVAAVPPRGRLYYADIPFVYSPLTWPRARLGVRDTIGGP